MITLNEIFRSDMIVQANKPVRFFGEGDGKVEITFLGESKTTIASGKWILEFAPLPYGGPHTAKVVLDGEETLIENIYAGDVYLLAGQSNMQIKLSQINEPVENYEGNQNVRLFTVDRLEDEEVFHAKDGWVELTKENAGNFSALGYYVSQNLAREDRKIGLIACYQGASVIQTWMPKEVAEREEFIDATPVHGRSVYPLWNDDGCLFEYQTSKIIPYSLSTVLWYQGEANTAEGRKYFELLKALIESYREAFQDEKLPFIVVQLADLKGRLDGWGRVQDDQLRAGREIENVHTVVCRDICEDNDIHPPTKRPLGKRISDLL